MENLNPLVGKFKWKLWGHARAAQKYGACISEQPQKWVRSVPCTQCRGWGVTQGETNASLRGYTPFANWNQDPPWSVWCKTLNFPAALCCFTSQTLLIYWSNWKRRWLPGEEGRQWIPPWPLQLLILCRETWNLITLIISLAHIATNVISSHKIIKALLKSIFKECVTCISRSEILISNTLTQTSETKCGAKQQWQGSRSTNEEWCHCLRETLHIINTLAH